jgi:hypothetical protein
LKSTDAQIVLREQYETVYGIFNHDDPAASPLAAVSMRSVEDASTGSLLDERMEAFVENRVGYHFNLSWTEFINQPTDMVLKQLEIALKKTRSETKDTSTILNKLNTAGNNGGATG